MVSISSGASEIISTFAKVSHGLQLTARGAHPDSASCGRRWKTSERCSSCHAAHSSREGPALGSRCAPLRSQRPCRLAARLGCTAQVLKKRCDVQNRASSKRSKGEEGRTAVGSHEDPLGGTVLRQLLVWPAGVAFDLIDCWDNLGGLQQVLEVLDGEVRDPAQERLAFILDDAE